MPDRDVLTADRVRELLDFDGTKLSLAAAPGRARPRFRPFGDQYRLTAYRHCRNYRPRAGLRIVTGRTEPGLLRRDQSNASSRGCGMKTLLLPDVIRDGLMSIFDSQTTNRLLSKPDLAQNIAIANGEARLRAVMTMRPLAAFAFSQRVVADVADADSFPMPLPGFDLDAELARIREMALDLVRDKQ